MAIGPLAELAVNRLMMQSLREQLEDLQRGFCERERQAYDSGVQHGRAAWMVGFVIGSGVGGLVTAIVVAWFS